MTLATQMQTDLDHIYTRHGVSVRYCPDGGIPVDVTMLLDLSPKEPMGLQENVPPGEVKFYLIRKSEVPAQPKTPAYFLFAPDTVNEETYYLLSVEEVNDSAVEWRVKISRSARRSL